MLPDCIDYVHAVCTCYGQWLPGDERGWRSRKHRIHSSGDYRNRPPGDEHAGLRRHAKQRLNRAPVMLSQTQREAVALAFAAKLERMSCAPVIVAVGRTHLHALYHLSDGNRMKQLGRAKQYASLKCPEHTGQLWGDGAKLVAVKSRDHFTSVIRYIARHEQDEGAFVWRSQQATRYL